MKKTGLIKIFRIHYLGFIIIFMILALTLAFAESKLPPRGENDAGLPTTKTDREMVQAFALVSPSSGGMFSVKSGNSTIKLGIDLKPTTIADKNLLPLKVNLEQVKTVEVIDQKLPRQFHIPPGTAVYKITAISSAGAPILAKQIKDTFSLRLGYPKGIKPEMARNMRVSVLYQNRWLPLPSQWDAASQTVVTKSAIHFSAYRLLARSDVAREDIIAYPNPVQFGSFGGTKRTVKFLNVPLGAVIEIYRVSGDKIREIDVETSNVSWDGIKDDDDLVTSGLYIYRVKTPGWEAFGKIAVLR